MRAAPGYRLEPNDAEPEAWSASLIPTGNDWRRIQLVSREAAELFASLTRPARLPEHVAPEVGARFVLDGILELETAAGYRSGPEAYPEFFPGTPPEPAGALARLSLAALRCAAALGSTDPQLLGKCLYRYNTRPLSPLWRRRFPDAESVARLFQQHRGIRSETAWTTFLAAPEGGVTWRAWELPDAPRPAPGGATWKLYISPVPGALGEATRAVLALAGSRAAPFSLKAGHDLPTLLRSEKLVVYFRTREQLFEAAERLRSALGGMEAQGVPFTSELFGHGLASWGIDPGNAEEPPGPLRQASWRKWVTARLGAALASATAAGCSAPAWLYAIDRVRLDGVTPETWTPPAWFAAEPSHADY